MVELRVCSNFARLIGLDTPRAREPDFAVASHALCNLVLYVQAM